MAVSSLKEEGQESKTIELDPKFIVILGGIWAGIKFIAKTIYKLFSLLYRAILRAQGKTVETKSEEPKSKRSSEDTAELTISDTTSNQEGGAFLNYGAIRWVHDSTPQACKNHNRRNFPDAEILKIDYMLGKELKRSEVSLFGDLDGEQIENIETALKSVLEKKAVKAHSLKEIHIVPALGKFLDPQGVPDKNVPGFTIDAGGACLLAEDFSFNPKSCESFFSYILQEDSNYRAVMAKAHEAIWNQSDSIRERLKVRSEYSPPDTNHKTGTFRARHIIDQDSAILGGVYLSLPAHEALIVERNGEMLSPIFAKLMQEVRRIKEALGIPLEEKILQLVMAAVQKSFPRTTDEALRSAREVSRTATDEELPLDHYIKFETGEADHKALLAAYLLDRLREEHEHYIQGKVSLDRNWLPGGGHAWVRYTHNADNVYIIDPAKNYFGRLDNYSVVRWPYERKSDLSKPRVARPLR